MGVEVNVMTYWKCPAGDFAADNEREKREHIKEMAKDKKHRDMLAEKTKSRGKGLIDDVKDKTEDFLDKFS